MLMGLTAFSVVLQVTVIVILLVTAFIDFDKSQRLHQRRVHILTSVSTGLIAFLTITEAIIAGVEAYDINKNKYLSPDNKNK